MTLDELKHQRKNQQRLFWYYKTKDIPERKEAIKKSNSNYFAKNREKHNEYMRYYRAKINQANEQFVNEYFKAKHNLE